MPPLMSFRRTQRQLWAGEKDVTRRLGWWELARPGLEFKAVSRTPRNPGLNYLEMGVYRVLSNGPSRLGDVDRLECVREGFPDLSPTEFVDLFCHGRPDHDLVVNRIEYEPLQETARAVRARRLDAAVEDRRQPVLVGESPGPGGCGWPPFWRGRSLQVLAGEARMTASSFLAATSRRNVLGFFPGREPGGKGYRFPRDRARSGAAELRAELVGRRVLLLGERVAASFDHDSDWFEWTEAWNDFGRTYVAAKFPHPSPISHFRNKPAAAARCSEFLREVLR